MSGVLGIVLLLALAGLFYASLLEAVRRDKDKR